jgi:hypothetical protein
MHVESRKVLHVLWLLTQYLLGQIAQNIALIATKFL